MDVVGEGGFSVVYRGQHLSLKEPIAIKCLKIRTKQKSEKLVQSFTQRFWDESRIMYRLSQGNLDIVRCITTGSTIAPTTGETVPYMVLEWLEGVSLAQDLRQRRAEQRQGRTPEELIELFEPAATAIAYAHSQGIVHRDVKPGNLFVHATRAGQRLKVLDFGMAKILEPQAMGGMQGAATLTNFMVASPQYATPEQLDPHHGAIGPWTDVYAFALILVEAMLDRRLRSADTLTNLIAQVARGQLTTPRAMGLHVSDAMEAVFRSALAVKSTDRQADMERFWSAFTASAKAPAPAARQDFAQTVASPPPQAEPPRPAAALGQTLPLSAVRSRVVGRQAAGQGGTALMPNQSAMELVAAARANRAASQPPPAGPKAPSPMAGTVGGPPPAQALSQQPANVVPAWATALPHSRVTPPPPGPAPPFAPAASEPPPALAPPAPSRPAWLWVVVAISILALLGSVGVIAYVMLVARTR